MTRVIVVSLTVLLLTASSAMATLVITVGDHPLLPGQADQMIQVMVQGDLEQVQGMQLRAMIGGGGFEYTGNSDDDGPIFKVPADRLLPPNDDIAPDWAPAMFPGTTWEGSVEYSSRIDYYPAIYTPHAQSFVGQVTALPDVSAGTEAVLVNFVIDTTGYTQRGATWDLELDGMPDGSSTELWKQNGDGFDPIPVTIENGTIYITNPLNSFEDGDWNEAATWDGPSITPTIYDRAVTNHEVIVDSDGEEVSSLSIDSSVVRVDATHDLTVTKEVFVADDATLTVNGMLSASSVSVDGTLSGTGTISTGGSIVINGIISPGDDGIGTLTLDNGEMALVSTYDAEAVVPEPGTVAMLLTGMAGVVVLGWRRRT